MKKLLTVLLFLPLLLTAKNYYVSSSGSNSNGGTITAPWQTIAKVNATTFETGDSILFKGGDSFKGTLRPKQNGLTFASYGIGKGIITGLTTISAWTNLGSNIWEATVPNGLSTLNMVVINDVATPKGRTPNSDSANGGYRTYESFVSNVSITDNQMSGTPNWTGADVLVRKNPYASEVCAITAQNSGTLTISVNAGSQFINNMGFFIQNDLRTLDQNGEWFYDVGAKKIKMYGTSTPQNISVSTTDTLVNMTFGSGSGKRINITLSNLSFQYANQFAIWEEWSDNLVVKNCDFKYIGETGIVYKWSINLNFLNNNFSDVNNIAMYDWGSTVGTGVNIIGSTFKNIGMMAGMIAGNDLIYGDGNPSCAITVSTPVTTIKDNIFDFIGYCAIAIRASKINQIVRRNKISNFCATKNDGGAIYNSGVRGNAVPSTYLYIDSNIILHSLDASNGTYRTGHQHTRGIYLDATSTKVNVFHNTISDCWDGIYISQSQYIKIRDNTIYNSGQYPATFVHAQIMTGDANAGFQHNRFDTITNNILFSKYPDQLQFYSSNNFGGIDSIGLIDTNYYCNTSTVAANRIAFYKNISGVATVYTLSQWQVFQPFYNVHSKIAPKITPVLNIDNVGTYLSFDYNATGSPIVVNFPFYSKMDATGTVYNQSVTIPAWSSKVLIDNGTLPLVNAGADQTILLPANSVILDGKAIDIDGTITKTLWSKISGRGGIIINP